MSNSEERRPKRNIDERIDALTMNQELQAVLQRDSGARLTAAIAVLTNDITRLTSIVETLAVSVIGHERRITSPEGGQPA